MKTSRPALQTSSQEECGVWLDTVQLKGKAKQKRLTRPISKLLNPFAEGGGYNVAVALNFTQTKMEMPKTKQSSISTFFTCQRRVLNKMSISEAPTTDPQQPCVPSTLSASTPVTSDTKRGQYADLGMSDLCYLGEGLVGASVDYVTGPEAVVCWEEDKVKHTPSLNPPGESEEEQCEEVKSPQRKKKFSETAVVLVKSDPTAHNYHQDHLMTCSQENDAGLIKQKSTSVKKFSDSEPGFSSNLQSEAEYGILVNVDGRTSTQKSLKHFQLSQTDDDKENSTSMLSESPKKHSTLSPLKPFTDHTRAGSKLVSPRKHIPDQLWKRAHNKENSMSAQFKWIKPCSSPLKRQPPKGHEDSLAMLFTQDSEGFRVIAHRSLHARSLLKDQSNLNKSYSEDNEEEDMLFTQDSQGNMVIKH
ncbi:aurora kinase A and ninein-interacting protein [Sphaeramia orbicularis]|uniref:aurora kinase A and ninein-interacting protein n=1 Tax=Sphaeramia orbicularis TaxID=375764 RepID=UPI00117CAD78|nr:aurora kinase A and ninein-interacting protein [Sphaeramia orbicularis]